jgi:hypothetical protein
MPIQTLLTTTPKWLYWLAITIMIVSALIVLYVSFLIVIPINPVSVSAFKIITPIVNTGTNLSYSLIYCAEKNTQFIEIRQLLSAENSTLYSLPSAVIHLDKGCALRQLIVITPSNIPAGQYKLLNSINIRLNSIQTAEVNYSSNVFNIINK